MKERERARDKAEKDCEEREIKWRKIANRDINNDEKDRGAGKIDR